MKRLPLMITCYSILISFAAAGFWYMPYSWRVIPRLEKPDITVLRKWKTTDETLCLVGGCEPYIAPRACLKIGVPISDANRVIQRVKHSNLPDTCDHTLIIFGTYLWAQGVPNERINSESARIADAVRAKYPNMRVRIVPIEDIQEIMSEPEYRLNKWHLNPDGFEKLFSRYQAFLTS